MLAFLNGLSGLPQFLLTCVEEVWNPVETCEKICKTGFGSFDDVERKKEKMK